MYRIKTVYYVFPTLFARRQADWLIQPSKISRTVCFGKFFFGIKSISYCPSYFGISKGFLTTKGEPLNTVNKFVVDLHLENPYSFRSLVVKCTLQFLYSSRRLGLLLACSLGCGVGNIMNANNSYMENCFLQNKDLNVIDGLWKVALSWWLYKLATGFDVANTNTWKLAVDILYHL